MDSGWSRSISRLPLLSLTSTYNFPSLMGNQNVNIFEMENKLNHHRSEICTAGSNKRVNVAQKRKLQSCKFFLVVGACSKWIEMAKLNGDNAGRCQVGREGEKGWIVKKSKSINKRWTAVRAGIAELREIWRVATISLIPFNSDKIARRQSQ